MSPSGNNADRRTLHSIRRALAADPALAAATRTYSLALTLSLTPALLPFVTRRRKLNALLAVLVRELGPTGFAFSMTVAVGGGTLLQRLLHRFAQPDATDASRPHSEISSRPVKSVLRQWLVALTPARRAFLSNLLSSLTAVLLIQHGTRRRRAIRASLELPYTPPVPLRGDVSPTLDLSLMLFVRAVDVLVQSGLRTWWLGKPQVEKREVKERDPSRNLELWISRVDAFVFWACSARIMWCFFYKPETLPRSYVKWISNLADLDERIVLALRSVRDGEFSYTRGTLPSSHPDLTTSLATDLGYPSAWGHPGSVPAFGGPKATAIWRTLGVTGRDGIGGMPCEIVHGGIGHKSCTANTGRRAGRAFIKALAIYIPVHILPVLLARPRHLLDPTRLLPRAFAILRSASFLSAFVSSVWAFVCLTRTLVLARLFPNVSHDVFDGPFGCAMAGSLVCGGSIWIENGRRRGEMALYVLPRAISLLPISAVAPLWRCIDEDCREVCMAVFAASLSTLLTAAVHQPESLRGLSRWALAFLMGPRKTDISQQTTSLEIAQARTKEDDTTPSHP